MPAADAPTTAPPPARDPAGSRRVRQSINRVPWSQSRWMGLLLAVFLSTTPLLTTVGNEATDTDPTSQETAADPFNSDPAPGDQDEPPPPSAAKSEPGLQMSNPGPGHDEPAVAHAPAGLTSAIRAPPGKTTLTA